MGPPGCTQPLCLEGRPAKGGRTMFDPSMFQQDVSAKKSLWFPELYTIGQQDKLFNYRIFSVTLLHGVSTSLTSFYIALWAFEDHVGSRTVGDYESFSVTVATSALLSVLVEVSTPPVSELGMNWRLLARMRAWRQPVQMEHG